MGATFVYLLVFALAIAIRYMLGHTQACLYVGKAISDTDSKTGLQDAVTPPLASKITIFLWLAAFLLLGYSFWSLGSGTGFIALAEFIVVTVVAGAVLIPKADSPHFIKSIYKSAVGRVADYARDGDQMRSDAMRELVVRIETRLTNKII